jgi:diketogulonate reductase-like aldo/keto reductase
LEVYMDRRSALSVVVLTAGMSQLPMHARAAIAAGDQSMAFRKIPSSGELLPVVGLGTWQTFDVGTDTPSRAPLKNVLREFISLGGKVIDSSPMYGRSEAVAGELIEALAAREKLFIATKVWTSGKDAGVAQAEESMKKLRAKPIELLQVHNLLDVDTHLRTLGEWKKTGRVRYVGVTHYTASAYDAVAKVISTHPVDFLQINYSVREREAERRLLPLARERGIAVLVNRPFAGGELFRRLRGMPIPAWAGEIDCASWGQLLLKFVISHPAITCVIPATSKVDHLRENMGAGLGRMPDEKIRAMIAASVG